MAEKKNQETPSFEDMLSEIKVDFGEQPEEGIKVNLGDKTVEEQDIPPIEEAKKEEVNQEEAPKEQEETKQNEISEQKKGNNLYKNLVNKFIESGKWENVDLEDEEGNVVTLSEMEDIDEDMFLHLTDQFSEETKKSADENYISKKEMSEKEVTIFNILKNGGDLKQIFKEEANLQNYLNPFEGINLDDEKVQEKIYLSALIDHKKLAPEEAAVIVEKAKKDFTLDDKAKKFVEDYNKALDGYVKSQEEQLAAQRKQEKEEEKKFKSEILSQYKEYDLKDTLARKLADSAINKSENGGYQIDDIYDERMKDPKEAAETILFLTDKKAYLDFKMKEVKAETHKETRKKFKMIRTNNKGKESKEFGQSANEALDQFRIKVE